MSDDKELGTKNTTTTAPTSAATHEAIRDIDLDEDASFASLVIMHHNLEDELLTPEKASKEYGIDPEEFVTFMKKEKVVQSLRDAGVIREYQAPEVIYLKVDNDWRDNVLTPLQLKTANMMLDLIDTRSQKKKLQDVGVSTERYQNWLRDPIFNAYLRKRATDMLGETQHEAHLALLDKVRMGDTNALKLYYEITGMYVPGGRTNDSQAQDFQLLLSRILEIINDEIDDPAIGARIADKFRTLIGANNMARDLTASVQADKPEIAGMRELTPRLRELMD